MKGSAEMLLEAQPTKGVQILWLFFNICTLPSLHTRYLSVNNMACYWRSNFWVSLISHCQTKGFAGGNHSWACHVGVIIFCISVWMEAFDLPVARWFEEHLPIHSLRGSKAPILCLKHSSSMVVNEDVPCAKSKSSDTVASIFPLCHQRNPPWAGVTLQTLVPLLGQPEHAPRAQLALLWTYWPTIFHGCLDNRDLEIVLY